MVGALSGVFYWMLHGEWTFPDAVVAVIIGYFGPDLIQAIMERPKPEI